MKTGTFLVSVLSFGQVFSQYKVPYKVLEIRRKTIHSGFEQRIFGGNEAQDGQFPYMVLALMYNNPSSYSRCSASLLRPDLVLFAAHCVHSKTLEPENIILVGQKTNLEDYIIQRKKMKLEDRIDENLFKVQERRAAVIYVHPDYDKDSLEHDLALLKLTEPFRIQAGLLQTTEISEARMEKIKYCTILGWGLTRGNKNKLRLNYATNRAASTTRLGCSITDTGPFICLQPDKSGICQGDSGSPLICDDEVWGVASHTINRNPNFVDCGDSIEEYYSEIYRDLKWLQRTMNGGSTSAFDSFGSLLVCPLVVVSSRNF